MDPFDDRILRALRDRGPRTSHRSLMRWTSPNTLRLHLNNLVERGLIVREKAPSAGPGRPKFSYSMPHGLRRRASSITAGSSEMIALPFWRLKRLCRFKRGGRCRETRDRCEARNCPQIQKGE